MIVSLIAAMSENRVIGRDQDLPWKLSSDLKNFKSLTTGHHILMGRKTFESMGSKPLKNRTNIIISKNLRMPPPSCHLFSDIDQGINFARKQGERELFVIGGASIYEKAVNFADKIYLTVVHTSIDDGDTYFPEFHPELWDEAITHVQVRDEKNEHPFTAKVLTRKKG
jgi:dihydrofolate reductase